MLHQKIVETPFKLTYGNYIGGEWREPVGGKYFDNITPVTGVMLSKYLPPTGSRHSPPI